jgi:YggT family protein
VILAASSFATNVAGYIEALATVYCLALILYVLTSIAFQIGLRIPYSRWSDAVLTFLRDVSEPPLRVLRSILPSLGGLDLSPLLTIIIVQAVAITIGCASARWRRSCWAPTS